MINENHHEVFTWKSAIAICPMNPKLSNAYQIKVSTTFRPVASLRIYVLVNTLEVANFGIILFKFLYIDLAQVRIGEVL